MWMWSYTLVDDYCKNHRFRLSWIWVGMLTVQWHFFFFPGVGWVVAVSVVSIYAYAFWCIPIQHWLSVTSSEWKSASLGTSAPSPSAMPTFHLIRVTWKGEIHLADKENYTLSTNNCSCKPEELDCHLADTYCRLFCSMLNLQAFTCSIGYTRTTLHLVNGRLTLMDTDLPISISVVNSSIVSDH